MGIGDDLRSALGYNNKPDEGEVLAGLARLRECSEYDIFLQAADRWNIPPTRAEADFGTYLRTLEIPSYVRSELRDSKYVPDPHHDVRAMLERLRTAVRAARRFLNSSGD